MNRAVKNKIPSKVFLTAILTSSPIPPSWFYSRGVVLKEIYTEFLFSKLMIATFLNNKQENSESFNKVLMTKLSWQWGKAHARYLFLSLCKKWLIQLKFGWGCVCVCLHFSLLSLSFFSWRASRYTILKTGIMFFFCPSYLFHPGQWDLSVPPYFCVSQRGTWVLKVSEQCKCWCIGHSCFSQKAFRALPSPLFPSSYKWFISWPLARKEPGLRSQAFDLPKEKGHTECNCARARAADTGIETRDRGARPSGGGWWERGGI